MILPKTQLVLSRPLKMADQAVPVSCGLARVVALCSWARYLKLSEFLSPFRWNLKRSKISCSASTSILFGRMPLNATKIMQSTEPRPVRLPRGISSKLVEVCWLGRKSRHSNWQNTTFTIFFSPMCELKVSLGPVTYFGILKDRKRESTKTTATTRS